MVGTLEAAAVPFGYDDLGGPVPADVVEAAQLAVEATGDQDRFVEDGGGLQVTDPRQLVSAGNELPAPRKDAVPLTPVDRFVDIGAGGQRESAGEILARAHRSML